MGDVGDAIQAAAAKAVSEPDIAYARRRAMRRRRLALAAGLTAAGMVVALSLTWLFSSAQLGVMFDERPEEGRRDDIASDAQMRPDLMHAEPESAAPGQVVELHFPQETERAIGFALEERVGDTWELRYYLLSTNTGFAAPDPGWLPADVDAEWPAVAITGRGPDTVVIPDGAPPGEYRICLTATSDVLCVEIAVHGDEKATN